MMKSRLINTRFIARAPLVLILLLVVVMARPLQADDAVVGNGTAASCTEAAFDAALATAHTGGGTITFNCGGPAIIIFTSEKLISADIMINGGDQTVLSGGNSTRLFYVFASGTLTLQNISLTNGFDDNYPGGAIYNTGIINLSDVTISNSTASSGGGIFNGFGDTATLTNVTLSGNSAGFVGVGIYNTSGTATLINVTLSLNSAVNGGGGISNFDALDSHLTLKNSIVANSTSGGNCYGKAADEALFSLWSDNSCTFAAGSGNQPNTDPLLGPLADNGGPTLTHLLLPGSPAIDAGTATGAPTTDQRGLPRPVGVAHDMGAVEVQPTSSLLYLYLPVVIKP